MNKIKIGKTVTVAGVSFIVLDKTKDGVLCLSQRFIKKEMFDDYSNNYAESDIRMALNTDFLGKIALEVGSENVLEIKLDLTSLDGLDDYGKAVDKVGLLTLDMYRKYSRIIEKHPVNSWWWLSTPQSTPHRKSRLGVCCVSQDGLLAEDYCDEKNGVRPFLILTNKVFE